MKFSVTVDVSHKPGVADPQGATIERALPTLGFDGISHVTVGKSIRFALEAADEATARSQIDDVVSRFLTNPVIEDSSVRVEASP